MTFAEGMFGGMVLTFITLSFLYLCWMLITGDYNLNYTIGKSIIVTSVIAGIGFGIWMAEE